MVDAENDSLRKRVAELEEQLGLAHKPDKEECVIQ